MQESSSGQLPVKGEPLNTLDTPDEPVRWQDAPLPEAREVAADVWKITVPIPFPLRTQHGRHQLELVARIVPVFPNSRSEPYKFQDASLVLVVVYFFQPFTDGDAVLLVLL